MSRSRPLSRSPLDPGFSDRLHHVTLTGEQLFVVLAVLANSPPEFVSPSGAKLLKEASALLVAAARKAKRYEDSFDAS